MSATRPSTTTTVEALVGRLERLARDRDRLSAEFEQLRLVAGDDHRAGRLAANELRQLRELDVEIAGIDAEAGQLLEECAVILGEESSQTSAMIDHARR